MYRIIILVIFSCVISVLCVPELVAQRGQGGGRPARLAEQAAAEPSVEQPASPEGEQPATEEEATGEEATTEETTGGEEQEPEDPQFVPPPLQPANALAGRLLSPDVAGLLGLDERQRSEVSRIVQQQVEEISRTQAAGATEAQFLEIYQRYEERLRDVLSATQRAFLDAGLEGQDIRIVFNRQPWGDVLQLIADQAGMQLVMSAPPPGTFSYASRERYTITQAIDLINNVLITHGYTLTRRDRMLLLLNLNTPVPNWSFPEVRPEDLQGRASSEFVRTTHPWGRRTADTVLPALEPLKGPFTRSFPAGNQVVWMDRVEVQLAVQRTIASIPEPPAPPQREQQTPSAPPPPPEWRKYTVEKNDPEFIEMTFREYVANARMLRLEGSRVINVFVSAPDHKSLEEILEILEEDAGETSRIVKGDAIIRTYPLAPYMEPQGLPLDWRLLQRMQQLQQIQQQGVPGVPPGLGPGGRGLGRGGPGGGTLPPVIPQGVDPSQLNQVQLFGLTLINVLRNTFPDVVVSDMPIADRIVITASESEHDRIGEFLETLRPTGEKVTLLQFYRFADADKRMTEATLQQLQVLVPTAMMVFDAQQGQILAVATARDHETLARVVPELESAAAPVQDQVRITYRLSTATLPPFLQMVQQLVVQDKLRGYSQIQDTQRNQVFIWATAEQHELIQEIYAELTGRSQQQTGIDAGDAPVPVADAVVVFTPKNISISTLNTVLEDVYPAARITTDTQRGQVIVRVRPEQKEPLQSLLAQLDAVDVDAERRYFKAYPITTGFYSIRGNWSRYAPVQFVADLQVLAPAARISFDEQSQQLIVWGTDEEHAIIEAAILNLIGDGSEKRIERFQLHRADRFTILSVVRRMFPTVLPTTDNTGQFLIVEGHPRLLPKIAELLAILDPAEPSEQDPVVMFYQFDVESASLPAILQGLQRIAPTAIMVPNPQSKQIMVIARPAEQKLIERSTDLIVSSFKEPERAIQRFSIRRFQPWSIGQIVQRQYPEVVLLSDFQVPGVLIVEADPLLLPKVAELIELLDPLEPTGNDPVVAYYSLRTTPTVTMIQGLQRLVPTATIVTDWQNERIMVIARPAEQETIKRNAEYIAESFMEPEKQLERFELRRMSHWQVQAAVQRMYPTARISFDTAGRYLVVEAFPELLPKIAELLDLLDPAEPTANDPVVRFYALRSEPTPEILIGLRQLAPFPAQIVPDIPGKQIMVFARPAEHKLIEASVELIVESFTPPEEPVLAIYDATREERIRLEAFMLIAAPELRGARIIPDGTIPGGGRGMGILQQQLQQSGVPTNRIAIWARPTEHELIATVLKQIQESQANVPDRQLKSFPMSVGDLTTAQNILRASYPDAMLFPDETGNRLMVWATAADMEKVTETLRVQGSIDDRQMLAYSIAGVPPATARTVIMDVFQGLRITEEPQTRKILVWASPDEHVKVAEIVEQINKEVDPDSELAEKFIAYSAVNLDAAMVAQLFQTIIPEASIHASPDADKIVVRAIARDHQRIDELFEQLREKDETLRPRLEVYLFGEVDPVMIEAMLRNQLPDAQSMSPDSLVQRLGMMYMYERYPPWWFGVNQAQRPQPRRVGYFNVDPISRSVHVFTTDEQHKIVSDAMAQIAAAGEQEGRRLVVRRYALEEMDDVWDVRSLVQRIAPTALIQLISQRVPTPQGWWMWTYNEFIAYTSEAEHERIATLVSELNDKTGANRKEFRSFMLPEGSPHSRERVIETIQRVFTGVTPMPGGTPNQIVVWATQHRLDQIEEIVAEVSKPLPEGKRTVARSYPLQYIGVEEAVAWLSALYPNVLFNPGQTAGTVQPPRPPFARLGDAKFVVAVATSLEHAEIEQTIQELDRDAPDTHKRAPRVYTLDDMPGHVYWQFFTSLVRAFPTAVCTPTPESLSVMVVATEEEHRIVADFIAAFRDDNERRRPVLEVYTLKRQNYFQVQALLQRIAPSAWVAAGSKPEHVSVFGTPKEQQDIAEALAKLESAADSDTDPSQNLRVYKTGTGRAQMTQQLLMWQFPGTLIFPISQHEIVVWASPVVQESISEMLGVVAEVFPDPELRPYFFAHVPLGEGAAILQRAFAGQAEITVRPSTGDLMVYASPDIHERIAASIREFDIPRPAETEAQTRLFDLTELPPGTFWPAVTQIHAALNYRIQVTQGIVPGQLVVVGKPADLDKVAQIVAEMLGNNIVPVTNVYDLSSLPQGAFWQIASQVQQATQFRVQTLPGVVPGQLHVTGRPADLARVDSMIKQILEERPGATAEVRTYTVHRGNVRNVVDAMIQRIAPNAVPYAGTTVNQIVVWATPSDHVKIEEAIARLNETDPDISLKVYRTGSQRAPTAVALLAQQFPGLLVTQTSQSELVAWATSAEHESISATLATVAEAFPDPVLRPYRFRHIPLGEGATFLSQAFWGLATMYQRPTTDDLLVFAPPEIHERIAASIQGFDLPSPETERLPRTYDLSDLPAVWFWQAVQQIPAALGYRVQVVPGVVPGQIVVWGRHADHEKVDMIVSQMLSERVAAAAELHVYTLQRSSDVAGIMSLIPLLAPNARPSRGTNLHQIIVWAKESDHRKIQETIDRMDDAGVDLTLVGHPLKNINSLSAENALRFLIQRQGLDITYEWDSFGNQFLVLASEENQKAVAEVLDSLRAEDRDVLFVRLQRADPVTAQLTINTLFIDDPITVRPSTTVDLNTNSIIVQGMEHQLARIRKLLRDMGENVREPDQSNDPQPNSNIRTLQLRGGADAVRELERIWRESQPNPLQVIREEETPSQFSVEDEIQRENVPPDEDVPAIDGDVSALDSWMPSAPPVYVVVGEDGTLTITSSDTDALDRMEAFLHRIETGILYEGRDFTVFAVRNISAQVVALRANQILSLQMASRGQGAAGIIAAQNQAPAINFDLSANTITVRGSRYWRDEAAKLIAMFDVSDWGERIARRPVTVEIKNTDPNVVYREVMNVYQQTLAMTQLPGGAIPRIVVNNTKSSLEIFAPEPLASELKEYAEEVDRKALEESVRKIHVIPLGVKANVVEQVLRQVRWQAAMGNMPMQQWGMMPMQVQPGMMMPVQMQPMVPITPFGVTPGGRGMRQW